MNPLHERLARRLYSDWKKEAYMYPAKARWAQENEALRRDFIRKAKRVLKHVRDLEEGK